MQKTTKLTLALVAMLALVGIGTMPVTGQVAPDCSLDFAIPDMKPLLPRNLDEATSETGWIDVGSEETTVEVELASVGEIEFGVFYEDLGCKVVTGSMSSCDDDEKVITSNPLNPQSERCVLKQAGTYFFHVVNADSVDHDYRIWEV